MSNYNFLCKALFPLLVFALHVVANCPQKCGIQFLTAAIYDAFILFLFHIYNLQKKKKKKKKSYLRNRIECLMTSCRGQMRSFGEKQNFF